jgi:hypothetical protein
LGRVCDRLEELEGVDKGRKETQMSGRMLRMALDFSIVQGFDSQYPILRGHGDITRVIDYYHRGTLAQCERGGEAAALATMSALVAPCWCSPVGNAAISSYTMLVMKSGAGKERYTIGTRGLLTAICPEIVMREKPSSHVGFFRMLRAMPGLFLSYDELSSTLKAVLSASNASSSKLIGTALLECYMGPDDVDGTATKSEKDSTASVPFPIPSVIGGCTMDSFHSLTKLDAFREDGLQGRFETVFVNDIIYPQFVIDKTRATEGEKECLMNAAKETIAAIKGAQVNADGTRTIKFPSRKPLDIDENARTYWQDITRSMMVEGQMIGGLWGAYVTRTPQRIMRTACILAFYRGCRTVSLEDVEKSNWWHLTNLFHASGDMAQASLDGNVAKIIHMLREHIPESSEVTISEIRKLCTKIKHAPTKDVREALSILLETKEISLRKEGKTGFFRRVKVAHEV